MCCAPGEGADTAKNRLPHHPATPVPPDEKTHPMQVSLLGAEAIVKVTGEISVQNIPYGPVYPAGFAGYITLECDETRLPLLRDEACTEAYHL